MNNLKNLSLKVLQGVVVLIGIAVFVAMIWFPLIEGRAAILDLLSIYSDPFIMYGYLASIPFFIALYQIFILIGYIRQNKTFSSSSAKTLRTIKHCAIVQSILIILAAIYIRISFNEKDDPAGFIAMCIFTTFISIVVATVAAKFERVVRARNMY